jgi:hypothetical protein
MSRNAKNSPTVNKKPYCKVCFDAGKPESEYTSHWVRTLPDRNGNSSVTCPTLLGTECRYCFKFGHTAKFCPVIEKNRKEKERADRIASHKELPKVDKKMNGSKKMVSVFDALRQDTDSEEEVEVSRQAEPVIENFPALGSTVKKVEVTLPQVKSEVKTGWATIVSKPKEDADFRWKKELEERSLMKSLPQSALKPQEAKKEVKQLPYVKDYSKPIYTKSWADWTDSDTDEDEEDEMPQHNPILKRETNMAPGWSTNFVMDDDW